MALIYKNGKYYESKNGQLTPYVGNVQNYGSQGDITMESPGLITSTNTGGTKTYTPPQEVTENIYTPPAGVTSVVPKLNYNQGGYTPPTDITNAVPGKSNTLPSNPLSVPSTTPSSLYTQAQSDAAIGANPTIANVEALFQQGKIDSATRDYWNKVINKRIIDNAHNGNEGYPGVLPPVETPVSTPADNGVSTPASAPVDNQANLANNWNDILNLFNSLGSTDVQGTQEDYTNSTSYSELSQKLQDQAMQLLNQSAYGYTPEEQQVIWDLAMGKFNENLNQDLFNMQNMAEKYGWSNAAGMGGQGSSMFQDYYGKRALAQSELAGTLSQQFAEKAATDKTNAINQALDINNTLYSQTRGDFADMLALMQNGQAVDAQKFNEALQTQGLISEQDQQNFLNQQGIDDRTVQDYFDTLEYNNTVNNDYISNLLKTGTFDSEEKQRLFLNQQGISDREIDSYFETKSYNDNAANQWLTYLQGQQPSVDTLANLLGASESDIASILQQAVAGTYSQDSPYAPLMMALGMLMTGTSSTGTTNTTNTDTGLSIPDWFKNLDFSNLKAKMPEISGFDASGIWKLLQNGNLDINSVLSNLGAQSLGGSITVGGKTYSVGNTGGTNTGTTTLTGFLTKAAPYAVVAGLVVGAGAIAKNWYDQTKEQGDDRRAYSEKFEDGEGLLSTYKDHNFGDFKDKVGGVQKYGMDAVNTIIGSDTYLNKWVSDQPIFNTSTASLRQAELGKIANVTGMNAFINNEDLFYNLFNSQNDYDGISNEDVGLIGLITPEFQQMYGALKEQYGDSYLMEDYFKKTDKIITKMYGKLIDYEKLIKNTARTTGGA